MIYTTDKSLEEYKDKIPAEIKAKIEAAKKELEEAVKKKNHDAIKEKTDALGKVLQEIGTSMYKDPNRTGDQTAGPGGGATPPPGGSGGAYEGTQAPGPE